MLLQVRLHVLKAVQVLLQKGDRAVTVVTKQSSHFAGQMVMVYVQMLKKNAVVPRMLRNLALLPMFAADSTAAVLFHQQAFQVL